MILIAYHLLESSIGAYTEWLANELIMTANKIYTLGFTTNNAFRKKETQQSIKLIISFGVRKLFPLIG